MDWVKHRLQKRVKMVPAMSMATPSNLSELKNIEIVSERDDVPAMSMATPSNLSELKNIEIVPAMSMATPSNLSELKNIEIVAMRAGAAAKPSNISKIVRKDVAMRAGAAAKPSNISKIVSERDDDAMRAGAAAKPLNISKFKTVEIESERDDKMGVIYPHDIRKPMDPLLEELHNLLHLSPLRCIYKVPERLRRGKEQAYTPQVVSIGPLHHGKEHLKAMEEHKKRYLRHFLCRTRKRVSFSDYIEMIKGQERRLRRFYAEPIELGSDEFVSMVLVDAAFVIEFLLRYDDVRSGANEIEDDYIFNKPTMLWDVRPDLRLLENQLPFFILQDLFNTLPSSHQLLKISYDFFKSEIDSEGKEKKFKQKCPSGDEQHFVDLLRILYLPLKSKTPQEQNTTPTPNVTELVQAGVELRVGTGSDLFDIKFLRENGILEIPKLTVDDTTDLTLRNLLAFEQCHHKKENYLTNYVFLMTCLVKTSDDVELLVKKTIIDNWLGDTQKISTLLHDLSNGMIVDNHYYTPLCEQLHDYCSKRRHKWMANLRQKYFNTPWSAISAVGAAILLALTFIQTVCSIISVA